MSMKGHIMNASPDQLQYCHQGLAIPPYSGFLRCAVLFFVDLKNCITNRKQQ